MKITRRNIDVTFTDETEAARFVARWAGAKGGTELYRVLEKEFGDRIEDGSEIYAAALRFLGGTAPTGKPEPTWTSRKGETFRLKDMPTPYLEAALRFAEKMYRADFRGVNYASGLADAIAAELNKRSDRR